MHPGIAEHLPELMDKAQALGCISFRLPRKPSSAGAILQHAITVVDSCFAKYEPMIYKVGFTHDPAWRWSNTIYGYQHAKDGWQAMTVLSASHEPYSPAMLEAALIERCRDSISAEMICI